MADAYYRSLYFSLDSPEDLKLLGMLLALPRWRRSPRALFERALAREAPESAGGIVRAEQAHDVQTATRRLETKLDELMKRSCIG